MHWNILAYVVEWLTKCDSRAKCPRTFVDSMKWVVFSRLFYIARRHSLICMVAIFSICLGKHHALIHIHISNKAYFMCSGCDIKICLSLFYDSGIVLQSIFMYYRGFMLHLVLTEHSVESQEHELLPVCDKKHRHL